MNRLYYYILFILLVSCDVQKTNNHIEEICISIEDANNMVPTFSDYTYIKLETNDTCLLENIVKAKLLDDDIYILSSYGGNIYKYSKSGNFLWKLTRGNGPKDLIYPIDFCIDEIDGSLSVLDNYRTIKKYNTKGEFIEKYSLDKPAFLLEKNNYGYMLFDSNLTASSDYNLNLYRNDSIVFKGLPIDNRVKNVAFTPSNVFVNGYNKNEYFIQHMLSDTIYQYVPQFNKVTPLFYINTEGKSANAQNLSFRDAQDFSQTCNEMNLIPGIAGLSHLKNKLYLMMFYNNKQWYIEYDYENKKTTASNQLCFGLPNSLHCVGRNKDFLVFSYRPEELYKKEEVLNDKAKDLLKEIKEDDNPVLFLLSN